jgi:ArsR family transcriptional regulator
MNDRELEVVLKALANKRRADLVRLLKKQRRLSVGVLADKLGLSFNATSRHLGQLFAAGVLDREQEGLTAYYAVRSTIPKHLSALISLL